MDESDSRPVNRLEMLLLALAAVFLGLFSLGLTLSPAVRLRTWETILRWDHWAGYGVWILAALGTHIICRKKLPGRDPYLLPAGMLLSGWGLLTIWRLTPEFGLRQAVWLAISSFVLINILRLPQGMGLLRRYKYIWLTAGLALTALTLVFGTNPSGGSPRLWLGCCGVYLQPSEPLKLLLVIYLAAYFSDRQTYSTTPGERLLPFLAPTLILVGLALLLLGVQRDLGTASVFGFLYAVMVFAASGRPRVLLISVIGLAAAGVLGYLFFDVVRIRVDAWINPWADPSGSSYQIVQSLLAVANGGILGRGPGLGSPGFVPVSHSDFIFTSIVEETGLAGGLALIAILALITNRSMRAALTNTDPYRRFLSAGLICYFVGQSILIVGGNLRLLPLTGVTLPFVSYGGSSLLVSMISLGLLLRATSGIEPRAAAASQARPYLVLSAILFAGLIALAMVTGWWTIVRSPELLARTDNPRRTVSDRFVRRGSLLDRSDQVIMESIGIPGEYSRQSLYPQLGSVQGYTHPIYGQSGLEASLDGYLRGLEGYPPQDIWTQYTLFGTPPTGLNVRLTLDLDRQHQADQLLEGSTGALVLLDAASGEILVMASHPWFDPNSLDNDFDTLINDPNKPLFNRTTLGQYPPGASLGPFFLAYSGQTDLPETADTSEYRYQTLQLKCALETGIDSWAQALAAGCPRPVLQAAGWTDINESDPGITLAQMFADWGFFEVPDIELDSISTPFTTTLNFETTALGQESVVISPLQMALSAAALVNDGIRPAPSIVHSVELPGSGWTIIAPSSQPVTVFQPEMARFVTSLLPIENQPYWRVLSLAYSGDGQVITWCVGGTTNRQEAPLALALVLEEQNPARADSICRAILGGQP